MKKIYGYKEKDVINLAAYINARKTETLGEIFEKFAENYGKAKGTVRNLYYALAKLSAKDKEFCDEYLGGVPIAVSKIKTFDEKEEKFVVKNVLFGVSEGKSVRKTIMEMTGGDAKKALRYQNKYRNALKNNPELIAEAVKEIKEETGGSVNVSKKVPNTSPAALNELKREINGLVERIAVKTKRENEYLKSRVKTLETENLRLNSLLYGSKRAGALKYFSENGGRDAIN